jgi:pimeloyl-ACP methyl ester carboxylesterase
VTLDWQDLGDVRVPRLTFGARDGRPVLLLPGLTDGLAPITDPRSRELLADPPLDLLDRHLVHVVSHRFPAVPPLTTRVLALDAANLLERVADRPAVIVGHSMGAMVAQHLAADRPDLVDRLVLSCTVGRADDGFRAVLARWEVLVRAGRWREFFATRSTAPTPAATGCADAWPSGCSRWSPSATSSATATSRSARPARRTTPSTGSAS